MFGMTRALQSVLLRKHANLGKRERQHVKEEADQDEGWPHIYVPCRIVRMCLFYACHNLLSLPITTKTPSHHSTKATGPASRDPRNVRSVRSHYQRLYILS